MLPLIEWLRKVGILEFVNALMTVSISVFAVVQLVIDRRERRTRKMAAISAFWVEYWRIWTVSQRWKQEDLDQLDRSDLFIPEEILPPDWGAILPLLGELGPMAARLGGLAYSFAAQAADHGRALQRLRKTELLMLEHGADDEMMKRFNAKRFETIEHVRSKARLAADTLEDALACVPKWAKVMKFDAELLKSDPGKKLAAQVLEQNRRRPLWHRIKLRLGMHPE